MTVNFRIYLCNVRGSLGEQEKLCKDGPEAVVATPPPSGGTQLSVIQETLP